MFQLVMLYLVVSISQKLKLIKVKLLIQQTSIVIKTIEQLKNKLKTYFIKIYNTQIK